ncbi:MAG: hypothetical protein JST54_20075 [Deltaproteobacteria bacterium]|nr:hypothetical protein [Deltaproteobacteria bacterium]
MKKKLAVCILLAFAGCELNNTTVGDGGLDAGAAGDGGPGAVTLSGPNAFGDAGAFELHLFDSQTAAEVGYEVDITNTGMSCGALEALHGARAPGEFEFIIIKVYGTGVSSPPPVGSYQLVTQVPASGYAAGLGWGIAYPDGGQSAVFEASDGNLNLTVSSDQEVQGSFQATVPDQNQQFTELSGTFDAPFCP